MTSRNQHVTKRSDGSWQVKGEGASKPYRVTRTQAEAVDIARGVTRNQGRREDSGAGLPRTRPVPSPRLAQHTSNHDPL